MQMAYIYDLDQELPVPVKALQGFPFMYKQATEAKVVPAVGCQALLLRATAVPALKLSLTQSNIGSEYSCVDVSLRLATDGKQVSFRGWYALAVGLILPCILHICWLKAPNMHVHVQGHDTA